MSLHVHSRVFLFPPTADLMLCSRLSSSMGCFLLSLQSENSLFVYFVGLNWDWTPLFGLSRAAHLQGLCWNDVEGVEGLITEKLSAGSSSAAADRAQCEPTAKRENMRHFAFSYIDGSQWCPLTSLKINNVPAAPFFGFSAVTSLPVTMAT